MFVSAQRIFKTLSLQPPFQTPPLQPHLFKRHLQAVKWRHLHVGRGAISTLKWRNLNIEVAPPHL